MTSSETQRTGSGKRLKCLFFDNNMLYINPTRNLLPEALSIACDLVSYGPGYVSIETLKGGIDRFYAQHGPFDVIVCTEMPLLPYIFSDEEILNLTDCHSYSFPKELMLSKERVEFMKRFTGHKVFTHLETDWYNSEFLRFLPELEIDSYSIAGGPELGLVPEFKPNIDVVGPSDAHIVNNTNNRWNNFISSQSSKGRIISLLHFVGMDEFCETRLKNRPHDWVVQGAGYTARIKARELLREVKYEDRILNYFYMLTNKLRINPYAHKWSIRWLRSRYMQNYARARYSYSCGSILRMPLRKALEIPAMGSILATQSIQGFEELGFIDGENAVICEPEEVLDIHTELNDNVERAQSLADAGRELILAKHTVEARGHQLGEALEAIAQGRFAGSRWKDGNFEVLTQKGAADSDQ